MSRMSFDRSLPVIPQEGTKPLVKEERAQGMRPEHAAAEKMAAIRGLLAMLSWVRALLAFFAEISGGARRAGKRDARPWHVQIGRKTRSIDLTPIRRRSAPPAAS